MKQNTRVLFHILSMGHNWRLMKRMMDSTGKGSSYLNKYSDRFNRASKRYNYSMNWLQNNGHYTTASSLIAKRATH
jgi:hypothetical protein